MSYSKTQEFDLPCISKYQIQYLLRDIACKILISSTLRSADLFAEISRNITILQDIRAYMYMCENIFEDKSHQYDKFNDS